MLTVIVISYRVNDVVIESFSLCKFDPKYTYLFKMRLHAEIIYTLRLDRAFIPFSRGRCVLSCVFVHFINDKTNGPFAGILAPLVCRVRGLEMAHWPFGVGAWISYLMNISHLIVVRFYLYLCMPENTLFEENLMFFSWTLHELLNPKFWDQVKLLNIIIIMYLCMYR